MTARQRALHDAMEEHERREFDGLAVADLSEVPDNFRGAVLLINDHGNVTLYRRTRQGYTEVASCV